MTDYTRRVTIVCPEAMTADANQFALVIGPSPADDQTFKAATWEDASGNLYAVSSTVATDALEDKATTTLEAPAHSPEADLTAARRAQAALYIYGVNGTEGAAPDRLWALVEPAPGNAHEAIALTGVSRFQPIDLNTADEAELQRLDDVGPERAQAIINGRPWSSLMDLTQIDGIGAATVEGWGARATVGM